MSNLKKKIPTKKKTFVSPEPYVLTAEFYQIFREELTPILL